MSPDHLRDDFVLLYSAGNVNTPPLLQRQPVQPSLSLIPLLRYSSLSLDMGLSFVHNILAS